MQANISFVFNNAELQKSRATRTFKAELTTPVLPKSRAKTNLQLT